MPQLVTVSLRVPTGSRLYLNVKTSNVGFAVVELRGINGTPLPGLALGDSDPIRGNSLAAGASWGNGTRRALHVPAQAAAVVVAMADAQLFSLWFDTSSLKTDQPDGAAE